MKRLASLVLWSFLFLVLLLAMDQVLLRVPWQAPGYTEVRAFYLDFRGRLLGRHEQDPVVKSLKPPPPEPKASRPPPPPSDRSPRYLYVDEEGTLQFADSLKEIPPPLRKSARRLER